jgi:hypothetical protein
MGSTYGYEMVGHMAESRINIAKLDNYGNVIWDKHYGEIEYRNYLINIKVLSDGSIIACGLHPGDYPGDVGWIIKVNENGDSLWYREYNNVTGPNSINRLLAVIETSDNGIAACGHIIPMPPDTGITEGWVLKLDSIGCEFAGCDTTVGIEEQGGMEAWNHGSMEIWPNPSHEKVTITLPEVLATGAVELVVYDVFGREAWRHGGVGIVPLNRMISLDVSSFTPGMYIVVIKDQKGRRFTGKFVVQR